MNTVSVLSRVNSASVVWTCAPIVALTAVMARQWGFQLDGRQLTAGLDRTRALGELLAGAVVGL